MTKGTIEIDAGESIVLKVGESSITIRTTGITINAPMITIGSVGTTTDINIMGDTINMTLDVNIGGDLNVAGILNVLGEATIDGIPVPPI